VFGARTCWNNRKQKGGKGPKRALEESIPNVRKYPPEDLSEWIKTEMAGSQQRRWEEMENAMKERKKKTGLAK
jgi:hypothetical protein